MSQNPPAKQDHLRLAEEDHVRIEQFLRTSARYLGLSGGHGHPAPPCEGPGKTLPWVLPSPHGCLGAAHRAVI